MIYLENIKKSYGNFLLDIEKMEFKQPNFYVLSGENGSGKTTLLKLILNLIQPGLGQIKINGMNTNKTFSWKNSVSSYMNNEYLLDFLNVDEYLDFYCESYKIDYKTSIGKNEFLSFFYEAIPKKKQIKNLSFGQKDMIGIIAALTVDTQIKIFDEPFAHLDAKNQKLLADYLNSIKKEKLIIISTHHKNIISNVFEELILLKNGSIIKK